MVQRDIFHDSSWIHGDMAPIEDRHWTEDMTRANRITATSTQRWSPQRKKPKGFDPTFQGKWRGWGDDSIQKHGFSRPTSTSQ